MAKSAAAKAAPTAVEFVPTAPSHRVVAYRGERPVRLGSGWHTENGTGLKFKLDFLPAQDANGKIEEIYLFINNREDDNG